MHTPFDTGASLSAGGSRSAGLIPIGRGAGPRDLSICEFVETASLRTLTSLHTFPPALTAESPVLQGPNANSFRDCTNYMHKRNATKQSKPPGFVGVEVHMAVRSQ